jgi:hypothetical protein
MNERNRNSVALTPQHQLEDAEQEYAEAIYRFRRAEKEDTADYTSAKLEMIRLEASARAIREHIYRGKTFELFEQKQTTTQFIGCPKPAWQ